ncbi:MAG: threonine synthase [Rhodobacteraceae bacterium]|nr:threonine synthase [Paracoccaceae bacterium]
MQYVSTRGGSPQLDFEQTTLAGLAPDGGLYVPSTWPSFNQGQVAALAGRSYEDVASFVMKPFVGDAFAPGELEGLIADAYREFAHPVRCPLVQHASNLFSLELFHGPTLAFKDMALQLVGRMFDLFLSRSGRHVTIVGATSGDTGSAAIEAFKGLSSVDVFILYPHGRVSDIQRRQMTTAQAPNVHAIAVSSNFDACQSLVKAMFNDHSFRREFGLAAVNSINWARILAQIVYYFFAGVSLGSPYRKARFVVPTGNFGDIYAGYAARCLNLPISDLVIATNQNDILCRAMSTGSYQVQNVVQSMSPSMDIQISSNFERVLFDAYERDGGAVSALMERVGQGGFELSKSAQSWLRKVFSADRCSETETGQEIRRTYRESGSLICPHTAVGMAVARRVAKTTGDPVIALATAHAAKFPEAVHKWSGVWPDLPPAMEGIMEMPERITRIEPDLAEIQAVVRKRTGK